MAFVQPPTRILLVEDHVAIREAIATVLAREPDLEVVAQAGSVAGARDATAAADIAIVDLGLPDGDGGEVIRELRDRQPGPEVIVLTASLGRDEAARAVERGAAATFSKVVALEELVGAVRRLRAGETLMPLDLVVDLLRHAGRRREEEWQEQRAVEGLTAREHEVLQLLAEGLTSQQIADRLYITLRTERNHVANVLAKLGAHSQLQAVVMALRYGVVEIARSGP